MSEVPLCMRRRADVVLILCSVKVMHCVRSTQLPHLVTHTHGGENRGSEMGVERCGTRVERRTGFVSPQSRH